MCSYHGWRFDEKGKCVRIPQEDNEERLKAACSNPRSCVTTHPCKVRFRFTSQKERVLKVTGPLLWIWTDDSKDNWIHAANAPFPLTDEVIAKFEKEMKINKNFEFTATIPYDFGVLMENASDPAHLPFSHHKMEFGDHRKNSGPLDMVIKDGKFPGTAVGVEYELPDVKLKVGVNFVPPGNIFYDFCFPFGTFTLILLGTPVDKWRSRIHLVMTDAPVVTGNLFLVLLWKFFPWGYHMGRCQILDSDGVLLHHQNRRLWNSGENRWKPSVYCTPTKSDLFGLEVRKWMEARGIAELSLDGDVPLELSKRDIMDRYRFHVSECKVCQSGLKFCRRVSALCKWMSQIAALTAVGLVWKAMNQTISYRKSSLALVAVIVFGLIHLLVERMVIPRFFFVNFSHAKND